MTIDKAYEGAKEVIRVCSTKNGLFASGGIDGYDAIWSRDSMISFLGASLVDDPLFKRTFRSSLITLGSNQSKKGQIPNSVDKYSERKPHVDFASIDSTLWYIIGHYIYKKRYGNSLFKKYKKSIDKAIEWLDYQDIGENRLLGQLPTVDWQDAFPHKYGYTINTHALYYKVLYLVNKKKIAGKIKFMMNINKDTRLWNGNFYVPYRWKNHNKYKEMGDWFDSLGNLLAIIFDLADRQKAIRIINHIEKKGINKPYPVRAIFPPIKKGTKEWQDYFEDCDARTPHHYLNGGIWTFIGGIYVLSLIKVRKFNKAKKELEKLAKANLRGNFPEWIDPITKENYGKLQAWNAGVYILAYESYKKKRVLL
ncbi:glycoside hydrolase 100 family protein [Nanoarchaeota archaeon]